MTHPSLVALLIGAALLSATTPADDGISLATSQWANAVDAVNRNQPASARQYSAAFSNAILDYVRVHGLDWQVEYLVGSLDCLFPEQRPRGAQYLQEILTTGRGLDQRIRKQVLTLLTSCTSPAAPTPVLLSTAARQTLHAGVDGSMYQPQAFLASSAHAQGAGISGDMKSGSMQLSSEPPVPAIPIPVDQLLARRTPLDQPRQALVRVLPLLPATATGSVTGPFAVVSATPMDTGGIGRCLTRYAAPLQVEFQIAPPGSMVTVYAVTGTQQLTQQAATLHGLQLPLGTIAYSVPEDNSLTAYATPTACGSMAHELLHLLIKRSFPGAPAWLEEGLASEIAVAIPAPTTFRMGWSWRDEALVQTAVAQPTLAELLETPWDSFTTTSREDLMRVQATQALAAVFIRYLDARGQLVAVYQAVRDRHLPADLAPPVPYAVLIAQATGDSLPVLQEDFNRWFQQQAASHRVHSGAGNDVPHGNCTPPSSPMAQQMPCPPPPAAGNDPATPGHP